MTTGRRIVLVLAIAFFCVPVALRMVGVHARPFENRPLAEKPSLSDGWDVFDQAKRFAVDRLPLREQAVRAHSWISLDVLDTAPTWRQTLLADSDATAAVPAQEPAAATDPAVRGAAADQVIVADDGWLLLRMDLERACAPPIAREQVVDRIEELIGLLRANGSRVSFIVPPDKTTVYPGRVPEDEPQRACARRYRAKAWPQLEAMRDRAVRPLRRTMLDAQARSKDLLYLPKDSHWNGVGAATALPAALAPFGLRVKDGEVVTKAPVPYTGDLTKLQGAPEEDTTPDRSVERIGERPRVLPGVTAFIHDSFGVALEPLLKPYVAELRSMDAPHANPEQLATVMNAQQVIIEVVERELDTAFGPAGRMTALADALRAAKPPP